MTTAIRGLLLAKGPRHPLPGHLLPQVAVHRCLDTADLVGRAMAGAADAAFIDPNVAGVDASVVAKVRSHGCRVFGLIAEAQDAELARRIGISEHVALPADPQVLRRLLQSQPLAAAQADPRARSGSVIAVWGPPGAPGRTTVSALLAVGAHRAGRTVVVVDADTAAAHWSLLTGSAGRCGLADALRRVAQGQPEVEDLLVAEQTGLDVLAAQPQPERWVEANPSMLPGLLDALARTADVVIVDCGADIRAPHPAYDVTWAHDSAALARAAVAGADEVVAVLGADPVGVHRFAAWLPVLQQQASSELLVANRMGVPRAGRHPQQQVASVLQALSVTADRVDVPWNPKAADALLGPGWTAARGWREIPQRLWSVLSDTSVRLAAG